MIDSCVDLACGHAILRALHHASIRSKATGRSNGRELGVAKYLVHTRVLIAATDDECDRLLDDAWTLLAHVLSTSGLDDADVARVVRACDQYARDLITEQMPHDPAKLSLYLAVACETAT